MISIQISEADGKFKLLEIKGHAESAPYGKDLVCAAVSAVTIGGLNNLEKAQNFDVSIQEGHVTVKAINAISAHDEIVIETIICGLKTIAQKNNDFIKVKAE